MSGGKKVVGHRRSNIELLRIVAMLLIILHHFAYHIEWPAEWTETLSYRYWFINFIIQFGKVGVGLFLMITGYFLKDMKGSGVKRALKIMWPVWFYSLSGLVIAFIMHLNSAEFSWPLEENILTSILPFSSGGYWFVTCYVLIVLLAPYLKKWLDALSSKQILTMIFIVVGSFGLTQIVSLVSGNYLEIGPLISPTIICVIIGHLIRREEKKIKLLPWLYAGILLLAFFMLAPLLLFWLQNTLGSWPEEFFWMSESVFCILATTILFLIFLKINFSSKIINYLASLTFGIYLIHDNVWVRELIWENVTFSGIKELIIGAIIMTLGIFVCSAAIEAVRKLAVKLFRYFWSKIRYNKTKEKI